MYLHSLSNRKFHLGLCHRYQRLQHHVLSEVPATSKIVNIRQFNKLIKNNTCNNKMICINKMTHVEIACRISTIDVDTACYSTLYDTSIEQNTTTTYHFTRWLIYSNKITLITHI